MKKTILLIVVLSILSFKYFERYSHLTNSPKTGLPLLEPTAGDRDNPYAAIEFRYKMIVGNKSFLDPLARQRAISYTKRFLLAKNSMDKAALISGWSPIGPGNIGGRIRSILVRPSNPNDILIGAVSGGIWKSTDGGASWSPKTDQGNPIAISSMTNNGDTVYAGTGEGWGNGDAVYGGGIYKSTDFGDTWTLLPSTIGSHIWNFRNIMKISIDPSNNIYAATYAYNYKDNVGKYYSNGGLYKSGDGGTTWTKISTTSVSNYYSPCDVIAVSSTDVILATRGYAPNWGGIFQTTNGGTTWNQITSGLPSSNYNNIALAQDPSHFNTVYAVFQSTDNSKAGDAGLKGIYKSTDAGSTWAALTKPPVIKSTDNLSYLGSQGWYGNVIAIDPNNSKNIYVGGVDMMKSTDGGKTWDQLTYWDSYFAPSNDTSAVIHADHHAIAFVPGTAGVVYSGNDGGIHKSTDNGKTWTSLNNGLEITQFYSGAVFPTGSTYYGGTQDNGHLLFNGIGTNWTEAVGGDGGYAGIDQTNSNVAYEEYVHLQISKTTGSKWFTSTTGLSDAGNSNSTLFIAPFALDPGNSDVIIAGSNRAWLSFDGADHWTDSSGVIDTNGFLCAVTVVNSSAPYLAFAGTTNGYILKANISGSNDTSWTNITPPNNNGAYVRRIVVDLKNKQNIYACYSGYNDDGKTPTRHIFYSYNQGTTWTDISGDLPDVPVHSLVIDPNNSQDIYVGTETGVYQTTDHGNKWTNVGNGMPAYVPVDELVLQTGTNKLFAFTHGRSVFETSIPTGIVENTTVPSQYQLLQNYPNPFNPSTTIKYVIPERSQVVLKVYDVVGKEVKTLVNDMQESGSHQVALNEAGLASGVYFYRITAGKFSDTKKMILLK
ncbi:MAG: T9SS type A sorting domain-containing protein [Ignavibacteriaceae bacterium]